MTGFSDSAVAFEGAAEQNNERVEAERVKKRGHQLAFLSHKHKDHEAAYKISNLLREKSDDNLHVFMSANIPKGVDWQDQIEEKLHESDLFIFLFSGTDEDWSWCHHEAGIFRGMMYPADRPLIVLHPSNVELPKPLNKYLGIRCAKPDGRQADELDQFLRDFFGKPTYPGLKPLNAPFANNDDARRSAADTIIDAVGRLVVKTILPKNMLIVHVPDITKLDPKAFPEGTEIRDGSSALDLFRFGTDAGLGWNEFLEVLKTDDADFQQRLDDRFWPAIYKSCYKSVRLRRLMPVHTLFRAAEDRLNYKPVLSRIEISGDNSATFYINFVHDAAGSQADVRNKSVARIFTALNLAHRFRWEIIDLYSDREALNEYVERHGTSPGIQSPGAGAPNGSGGLAKVWKAIRLLESEAQNRGIYNREVLPADFGPANQAEVGKLFPIWEAKRLQLEQAAQTDDTASFADVLQELDPINVRFISLAAERLSELVRTDFDEHARLVVTP